jgi:RimJ/RimL family protein N-acetyltransferase
MTAMPPLETGRLLIRPFQLGDLDAIHQILDVELSDTGSSSSQSFAARRQWLDWTILSYTQLAQLYQPPYGDRAVVAQENGELVGAVGFVPVLAPFGQLTGFQRRLGALPTPAYIPDFGLFYAIRPDCQRRGYAAEAASALILYAFEHLHLAHIVATTTRDNLASIGVMRKLGMRIETNPLPDPPWFQVIGILENPDPLPIHHA